MGIDSMSHINSEDEESDEEESEEEDYSEHETHNNSMSNVHESGSNDLLSGQNLDYKNKNGKIDLIDTKIDEESESEKKESENNGKIEFEDENLVVNPKTDPDLSKPQQP